MEWKQKNALRTAFARRMRMRRAEIKITQEQLAANTGLSQTYLNSIERGERNITIDTIQKISSALKLDIKTIFSE